MQPVPFRLETSERPRAVTIDVLNTAPPAPKIDTTTALTQPQPFNLQVRSNDLFMTPFSGPTTVVMPVSLPDFCPCQDAHQRHPRGTF